MNGPVGDPATTPEIAPAIDPDGRMAAITVLGIGNPIMGDDGVGLCLLAALQSIRTDPGIEYVDGGTGGMELLPVVQDSTRLLILDAVDGTEPGAVRQVSGDQIPRLLQAKLSPHQVGLLDVFAAARLLGKEPELVEAIGIVPESVELRLGLTARVEAAVPVAVALAADVLDQWLTDSALNRE
ncbi:MAG: hydrogenase maturation protease [Propionibacteriaceae bacterium]|jgi:hydrogenase maturation protease|nr:hydrogenase maturation protease [Propionibacteriaceae bacterium]